MSITYPPDIEESINRLVETGRFSDSVAAMRAAVQLLEDRERTLQDLRAMLQVGLEQAERGELAEWSPELHEKMVQSALLRAERGEQPSPDVCP